jgi:hypothetical protein
MQLIAIFVILFLVYSRRTGYAGPGHIGLSWISRCTISAASVDVPLDSVKTERIPRTIGIKRFYWLLWIVAVYRVDSDESALIVSRWR